MSVTADWPPKGRPGPSPSGLRAVGERDAFSEGADAFSGDRMLVLRRDAAALGPVPQRPSGRLVLTAVRRRTLRHWAIRTLATSVQSVLLAYRPVGR
jgi:hypothetical protein